MMRPMPLTLRHSGIPIWGYKALLLLAAAIWGLGTVAIKSTVDTLPPTWIVGLRFTGAGLILGTVSFPKVRRHIALAPKRHLACGTVLGVLLFLSYWANSTGLADTTASNSSFLTTLYVVIIPFLGWWIIRKKPTGYNIVAALACAAGLGFVAYGGADGFLLRFGDLITILSAFFLSLHVLYTAKFAPELSVTALTAIQFLVAGVLGTAVALTSEPLPNFAALPPDAWGNLAYLTVMASCVALGLQNAAVARVDPAQASLFLAMEAVFGVLFSVLLLGEAPSTAAYTGFALIFCGMVISEYLPLRAQHKQAAAMREETGSTAAPSPRMPKAAAAEEEALAMEASDTFMR